MSKIRSTAIAVIAAATGAFPVAAQVNTTGAAAEMAPTAKGDRASGRSEIGNTTGTAAGVNTQGRGAEDDPIPGSGTPDRPPSR